MPTCPPPRVALHLTVTVVMIYVLSPFINLKEWFEYTVYIWKYINNIPYNIKLFTPNRQYYYLRTLIVRRARNQFIFIYSRKIFVFIIKIIVGRYLRTIVNFQIHISVGRTILLIWTGGVGRRDTLLYRTYIYICIGIIYIWRIYHSAVTNIIIIISSTVQISVWNISHVPRFCSPVIPAAVCVGLLFYFIFFILFIPWCAEDDDRPLLQQWCLP